MTAAQPVLHRALILADESAAWRVAGLPQLQRLLLSLNEYAETTAQRVPISVSIHWKGETPAAWRSLADSQRLPHLEFNDATGEMDDDEFDLVLSTRVFLYRNSIAAILDSGYVPGEVDAAASWDDRVSAVRSALSAATKRTSQPTWQYLTSPAAIPAAERAFLRQNGKTQDGLVSRYLNRPVSRAISRWLLKTEMVPSTWSVLIFALPLAACIAFLQGTPMAFIIGAVVFQLYSILDGCDGEIARSRFQHTTFGRRLDSLLDLAGNMLLAICLGLGLARFALPSLSLSWFYIAEGMAAAFCVVLSEGIVFLRRSRRDQLQRGTTALNGALYARHNEFFQRSGILVFGETAAWWMVFLTKRDMAMLAFVFLAIVGYPQWILHLLLGVGAINSALAGNAFFRAPAPALQQEAS